MDGIEFAGYPMTESDYAQREEDVEWAFANGLLREERELAERAELDEARRRAFDESFGVEDHGEMDPYYGW